MITLHQELIHWVTVEAIRSLSLVGRPVFDWQACLWLVVNTSMLCHTGRDQSGFHTTKHTNVQSQRILIQNVKILVSAMAASWFIFEAYVADIQGICGRYSRHMWQIFKAYVADIQGICGRYSRHKLADIRGICSRYSRHIW